MFGLKPFFTYYGGKWRDSPKHYPAPKYTTIVEPFAGSAGYSLRNYAASIILCDLDPIICSVWDYLIHVSSEEILRLPDMSEGQVISDLRIPQEARWVVGFWVNTGCSRPRNMPSTRMLSGRSPKSYWGPEVRLRLATQVEYIRHWKIFNCSYENAPYAGNATWFIDPPYQKAGIHYKYGSKFIDYGNLATWCKARPGQIIVCEGEGAGWLPFAPIGYINTSRVGKKSLEASYVHESAPTGRY